MSPVVGLLPTAAVLTPAVLPINKSERVRLPTHVTPRRHAPGWHNLIGNTPNLRRLGYKWYEIFRSYLNSIRFEIIFICPYLIADIQYS